MKDKTYYETIHSLHDAEGKLAYALAVFGDSLAEREGYRSVEGLEAVYFYLVHKFAWTPAQVRGMSYNDLRFILEEEMHGFVLPEAARY